MNVSMDGLRRSLARSWNELISELIQETEKDSWNDLLTIRIDKDTFINLCEEVRSNIGILNCIFIEDNELFNDLSCGKNKVYDAEELLDNKFKQNKG